MTSIQSKMLKEKYLRETNAEERQGVMDIIRLHAEFLRNRTLSIADIAFQYLYISHLGGLAGSFTYLASKPETHSWFLKGAIGSFAGGLILVGVALAVLHNHFSKLVTEWNENSVSFYENEKTFGDLLNKNNQKCKVVDGPFWLCIVSLGLMVLGLIFLSGILIF